MKVSAKQYAKLLQELTSGLKEKEVEAVLAKIAKTIRENKDQRKLGQIIENFSRLYMEENAIIEGAIITARKLRKKALGEVNALIAKKYGSSEEKVFLKEIVDPGIKGGIIIKIGNEVWDGSIKARLEKLKVIMS